MRWHVDSLLTGNFAEGVFGGLPLAQPHAVGGFFPRGYGFGL
jgi:hypothetical protein